MSEGDASELPEGWALATIGDLIESSGVFTDGDWVESKDQDPTGEVRLIQLADVGDGRFRDRSNRHLTREKARDLGCTFLASNDILVARMPDPLGRACLYPGSSHPAVTVVDVCVVRPSSEIDTRWLMHSINSPQFREWMRPYESGSTRKRISRKNLAKVKLPVPPVEEQKRIADALEEQMSRLDVAVEAVERSRTRSWQLWSSVLHQMTEGTLSRNVRHPVPWERVDEVAAVQGGIQKQAKRRPAENKFPFLRVANVPRGSLTLDDVHEIELFEGELERYRLKIGDLLVVEGNGSPDQIGRAALWRGEIKDCVHQNHLIRIRPGARLRAEFLELAWNSPKIAQQLKKVASSTSGLHTLSTAKIKSVQIPVPSLEEQDALLSAVQQWRTKQLAAEGAQQVALARAAALRRSLLAEALVGRLVPQDPADEPTDALLDRIRAEREAAAASKSRRRSTRRTPAQRRYPSDITPERDAPPPPPANAPALASATQPTLDLEIPS
ncbi:restriction endonuclease subunit S [Streptomyces sp. RK75]|uniref:restriction endonuclease subunit S n=1 Tax=Streptomyces sp. RK75 TaxID=2824895 RepID=UPI001B379BB2|nr:restriction endonuclease subunit S [Streptomyces sp. RK75]MBQ0863062.1 restriction endonuclease subunit S [Streptomyces sp. RK75]